VRQTHGAPLAQSIIFADGGHRLADPNEPFQSMLKGPGRTAVRQPLHERDTPARRTATRYHQRQRETIHLRPMEGNQRKIRNRMKTQHGFLLTNGWTDRTDQCHNGTISTHIHQLSTARLVWLLTTGRICIQHRISGNHQEHTVLCKLRNQPRIRDDRSSDPRRAYKTRRKDSIT